MRFLHLSLLLLTGPAYAQQLGYVPSTPTTYRLAAKERVPAYKNLADSSKVAPTLAPNDQVSVVGRRGAHWAVMRRNSIDYFIRSRYIQGLPAPTPAELVIPVEVKTVAVTSDSVALPIDKETGLITYSKVVPVAGVPASELYARAKLWYVATFNSSKDALQADEKEAGILIGKGWSDVTIKILGMNYKTKLWYTIKLAVRDGRYKYDLSNFGYEDYPSQQNRAPSLEAAESVVLRKHKMGTLKNTIYSQKQALDNQAHLLSASIEASMAKPAAGGDW